MAHPVAGIRRGRLQRIVRTVNSALNSCKGLMAIISFGKFADSECQVAARQPLGTTYTLAVIQIVVTVIGADLRVCKCDAHFSSGCSAAYRCSIVLALMMRAIPNTCGVGSVSDGLITRMDGRFSCSQIRCSNNGYIPGVSATISPACQVLPAGYTMAKAVILSPCFNV